MSIYTDYEKIKRVVLSCNNITQMGPMWRYIELFQRKHSNKIYGTTGYIINNEIADIAYKKHHEFESQETQPRPKTVSPPRETAISAWTQRS